jgi:transcriptional regulator with PAS, ATPase and Fis domain
MAGQALNWNRLENLRAPKSLSVALQQLGIARIEVTRREMRSDDPEAGWITLPLWLKGQHRFIERVQKHEVGSEILRRTRQDVQEESERLQETIFKSNGIGLTELCVPIVLAGNRIGFIHVNGFVTEQPPPGDVVLQERLRVLMLSESEIVEAIQEWRALPHFSADKRQIVVQMLEILCREIVQFFEEDLSAREREEAVSRHTFNQLVTTYPPLRQTLKRLQSLADSDSSVLIYGESGTGRELLAKMIHERSHRKDKTFKILHCSSVTENLLEAELLGYEKGAFAGAYSTKQGLVEQCAGGTLYLKEIGDLSLSMQLKILKIIEEQTYTRLGGAELLKSNVRVVASTARNLRKLIGLGTFREDLFFRLNVVELEIPPLRQRREDIALLAEHFLRQFCAQMKKEGIQWKEEALLRLQSHPFPGNVRELKNEVERIVAMKDPHSFIDTSDLSPKVIESLSPIEEIEKGRTLKDIVDTYEKKIISEALAKYHWNKSRVAELFQITRQGLMKKITKHRLDKRKNI